MNNIEDVKEWHRIADSDFDSAILLNEAVRRHLEIICYHCAQSVEKYLKGYLVNHDIIPLKTHDLPYLRSLCEEIDNIFATIKTECDFLNRFANDIRYPHRRETTESDVSLAIGAVEKIRNIKPILDLREVVAADYQAEAEF